MHIYHFLNNSCKDGCDKYQSIIADEIKLNTPGNGLKTAKISDKTALAMKAVLAQGLKFHKPQESKPKTTPITIHIPEAKKSPEAASVLIDMY
jgi:hypothetical protein